MPDSEQGVSVHHGQAVSLTSHGPLPGHGRARIRRTGDVGPRPSGAHPVSTPQLPTSNGSSSQTEHYPPSSLTVEFHDELGQWGVRYQNTRVGLAVIKQGTGQLWHNLYRLGPREGR